MLQALLEDRQAREKQLAEERERREQERQEEMRSKEEEASRREAEMREEFRRREEESARREEMMRQQMELLKTIVTDAQERGEKTALKLERDRDVKVAKLTEEDDIEAYLTTFERLMKAYEVKKERWSFKLAPQLVGKAQQAYAAMAPDEAMDYDKVKRAILRRYDITEESYRQRFRALKRKEEETSREVGARLRDLADKWLKDCTSVEEVKDQIVLEQLINTLPADIQVWVKERKPKSSEEASQLADDYVQARKQNSKETETPGSKRSTTERQTQGPCEKCGKMGHQTRNCFSGSQRTEQRPRGATNYQQQRPRDRSRRDIRDVQCFNCHKKGHYSLNCPNNAMLCRGVRIKKSEKAETGSVHRAGRIEGKLVQDILLDTGYVREH